MLSPSDWPTSFGEILNLSVFDESSKDKDEKDLVAETQRRMEQDIKQNHWELELEKIKQQFMNSTPFKTRLTGDRINTYDGNVGRQEIQQAKKKALSDFSNVNFQKDSWDNLFKVEFDVDEFDPETVKVRLEDDTLVVEAKQQTQAGDTHRSKREFYRKVVVPAGANSDRMICKLSTTGILEVKIPAPPSYSEAFKDSKKNTDTEYTPSSAGHAQSTTDYTTITTGYSPSTTGYHTISSSPKRYTIRTREYKPTITRTSSEYTPSSVEYSSSIKRSTPVTRGYSTSTTEYVPAYTPSTTRFSPSTRSYSTSTTEYVPSSTTRFSPSTTSYTSSTKEYTPGISRKSTTYTGYSPTKYSTLPSRPRQKSSSKVYLGRSHTNTIDPKWRTRQQKISLSDSLDSEATLSSSPSDDLYGHNSFSDLDL